MLRYDLKSADTIKMFELKISENKLSKSTRNLRFDTKQEAEDFLSEVIMPLEVAKELTKNIKEDIKWET